MFLFLLGLWNQWIKIKVLNKPALFSTLTQLRLTNSISRIRFELAVLCPRLKGTLSLCLKLVKMGRTKTWLLKRVASYNSRWYNLKRNSNRYLRNNKLRRTLKTWEYKILTETLDSSRIISKTRSNNKSRRNREKPKTLTPQASSVCLLENFLAIVTPNGKNTKKTLWARICKRAWGPQLSFLRMRIGTTREC